MLEGGISRTIVDDTVVFQNAARWVGDPFISWFVVSRPPARATFIPAADPRKVREHNVNFSVRTTSPKYHGAHMRFAVFPETLQRYNNRTGQMIEMSLREQGLQAHIIPFDLSMDDFGEQGSGDEWDALQNNLDEVRSKLSSFIDAEKFWSMMTNHSAGFFDERDLVYGRIEGAFTEWYYFDFHFKAGFTYRITLSFTRDDPNPPTRTRGSRNH